MAGKESKGRKIGRNRAKCDRYRHRVGKPAGRGMVGSKHPKGRGAKRA